MAHLASWLREADRTWLRSGGPTAHALRNVREHHNISLALLTIQERIGTLSGAWRAAATAALGTSTTPFDTAAEEVAREIDFAASSGLNIAPGGHGFRRLRAGVATEDECALLRAAMTAAMVSAFRRGGQTTLSVVPSLAERLSAAGVPSSYELLLQILERVRVLAEADDDEAASLLRQPACPVCGKRIHGRSPESSTSDGSMPTPGEAAAAAAPSPRLYHRGALLVRLMPPTAAEAAAPACWQLAAEQPYWDPHVDAHNVAEYDVSAVLYLASQGEHFSDGSFAFHDEDADCITRPASGSLLTFSSGAENPHSAGRVSTGVRFALAMWFTRERAHAIPLPPSLPWEQHAQLAALPLWAADRSIESAAHCCLASNDPLYEALAAAQARGLPLSRALAHELSAHAAGGDALDGGESVAHSGTPAAWLERAEAAAAATDAMTDAADEAAASALALAILAPSSPIPEPPGSSVLPTVAGDGHSLVNEDTILAKQLLALRAAVRARVTAHDQITAAREASAGAATVAVNSRCTGSSTGASCTPHNAMTDATTAPQRIALPRDDAAFDVFG